MNLEPYPVVNGCYVSDNSLMYKVKLVSMQGSHVSQIVVEDVAGYTSRWTPAQWHAHSLIPCCLAAGPYVANNAETTSHRATRKVKDKFTTT